MKTPVFGFGHPENDFRTPKHEMTTLRAFLDSRRVATEDTTWNLTGMGRNDAGKYYISNSDYDDFLRLHHEHAFIHSKASSFLEKHSDYSPILIDLDFRYAPSSIDRQFTKDDIRTFVKAYADAFFKFIDHGDSIRFFVEVKPTPTLEKDIKKDGIHIICPDITVAYTIPFTLRKYLLEQGALSCFSGFTNTCEDCFDESVIKRNNWFLHGATKPEKARYSVVYCFIADPDGGFDETEWDESDSDLTSLFSLQHNRDIPTPLTIRLDMRDEWAMWESLVDKKPNSRVVPVKHACAEDSASVSSHISVGISKILNFNGCVWEVTEQSDGYKITHNSKACLVESGYVHSDLNHSCIFVQRSHATMSCLSHRSKRVPKGRSLKLWNLLAGEEDDVDAMAVVYADKKTAFEERNFRVLNPPGYMTRIDDSWIHYTRQQLIDMNSGLFLDDDKKERFIDWWLRDEGIRAYSRIGYFVDRSECPTSVFNTFTGFAADALCSSYTPANIDAILYHIRLLCNHNEEAYEFVLDWFASIIQHPGFLHGVCLIFKGRHGCGKDMFLSWIGSAVIGLQNYYKTARPHIDLFGAFNSSRKDIVFYHIEEGNDAVFKDTNLQQFKNYITDPYASIQLKLKNTNNTESLVKNYNHFAVSTNHVITCEVNERRFFGVDASSEKCKQSPYFNTLATAMADKDVVATFYHMLQHRDISCRNWSDLPQTDYMKEMQAASVPDLYYFLEEYIEARGEPMIRVKASDLYEAYRDWHSQYGTNKIKTVTVFGREIKNIAGINKILDRSGKFYEIQKTCLEFIKSTI